MYQAQKKGFNFPNFGITGIIGAIGDKFKRSPEKQAAYEAIMGSVNPDSGRGTYKGNEYRIQDGKIYSELYPQGKNFDSGFGSQSIEEMENEGYGSIGWAQDRLQKGKKISKRLHNILRRRGIDESGNWINRPTDEGAQFAGDGTPKGDGAGAVTTGGGGTFNPAMDPKGRGQTRDSWHGATAAREAKGEQVAGPGFGSGAYWAKGGRVGYNRGRVVNPGGYRGDEEFEEFEDENTLDFMRDQGVPYGEMAEGTSAFDLRVQELVDEGMSWQQAWSIASQEFGLTAEGPEESFSEEGLASLV
jgi:hypothetical protein